jgi:hypothetical protein
MYLSLGGWGLHTKRSGEIGGEGLFSFRFIGESASQNAPTLEGALWARKRARSGARSHVWIVHFARDCPTFTRARAAGRSPANQKTVGLSCNELELAVLHRAPVDIPRSSIATSEIVPAGLDGEWFASSVVTRNTDDAKTAI